MSTTGICQQFIWNESASIQNDWSWICYYYPAESENPLDHNMVYKAVEEFEKTNPNTSRISLRRLNVNLSNSSLPLNGTTIDFAKTSTSILLLIILSIIICGICYLCKKPRSNNIRRSSEDSEDSEETVEDEDFIE